MWRSIRIEVQSIDIKDCYLKRDLSTLLILIFCCDASFNIGQKIYTAPFISASNITEPKTD